MPPGQGNAPAVAVCHLTPQIGACTGGGGHQPWLKNNVLLRNCRFPNATDISQMPSSQKNHAQAGRSSAGPPCAFWPIPPVAWVGKRRAVHGNFFHIWQFWRLRRAFNIEKGSLPPRMAPPGRSYPAHCWVRFRPRDSGRFWTKGEGYPRQDQVGGLSLTY